jgi:hypothetical protein
MKKMIALLILLVIITSCSTFRTDFSIISSKNIELSNAAKFTRANFRVEGVDKTYIIVIIPTGTPNLKEAIDRAIEQVPGCVALVDGVLSFKQFYIPYVYGEYCYTVEGTPLIDPEFSSTDYINKNIVVQLDKSGNVEKLDYVSKKEYEKIKQKFHKKTS